ncbi:MAG: RNA methyltransferase [Phycisphaerales bacterium]
MPTFVDIVDALDERVAPFRDVRDRDLRGRDGTFLVESARIVRRLLGTPFRVRSLLLTPRRRQELLDVLSALPEAITINVADEAVLGAISGYHVHGGALAIVERPSWRELTTTALLDRVVVGARRTLVALAGVTHMDNVGSIFRSAAGLSCDGVILDDRCCDPLLRKPIRVAMGHSLTTPFAQTRDLLADLRLLRDAHGFAVVGAESREHPAAAARIRPLCELPRRDRVVLLFGNEGHGLDAELIDGCDALVEIPMRREVPSLNVAVAAAIVMYERSRSTEAGAC